MLKVWFLGVLGWLGCVLLPSPSIAAPLAVTAREPLVDRRAEVPVSIALGVRRAPYVVSASQGILVELLTAVYEEMGQPFTLQLVHNAQAITLYQAGRVDAIAPVELGILSGYPSQSFITFHNQAFSLSDRHLSIDTLDDLAGLRVAAFDSAHYLLGEAFGQAVQQAAHYIEYQEQQEQVKALLRGDVDVVICDRLIFEYHLRLLQNLEPAQWPQSWKSSAILPPNEYRVVFHRPEQAQAFDSALLRVQQRGELARLQQRYLRLISSF